MALPRRPTQPQPPSGSPPPAADEDRLIQAQRTAAQVLSARLPLTEIRSRQQRIHREMLELSRTMDSANFRQLGVDDLRRLAMLYDREFFGSRLLNLVGRDRLQFGFSSRMTRIAGKLVTQYPDPAARQAQAVRTPHSQDRRQFQLVLSTTLLFQAFGDVSRPITVTGLPCADRLEAMQRVCEHELVHLLEMFLWNDSACTGPRFQTIAGSLFGHTEHSHDLITQRERAARNFGIRIGDRVRFWHEGRYLSGHVNRITRRATVLVPDAAGEPFTDGGRYRRYYVPIEKLQLDRAA